jgi:lipoprotein-anchoring transpeptidase ErfK/SrfK
MKSRLFLALLATAAQLCAQTPSPSQAPSAIDRSTLHVQVILDHLGFSPGVLDGKGGQSLVAALKGFQEARGLERTGTIDRSTLRALYPYRGWRPTVTLPLSAKILAGPFTRPFPKEPVDQARLPGLNYRGVMEALAEKFHTTPETLIALNSADTPLRAGTPLVLPNSVPTSRAYEASDPNWVATLNSLNVDARPLRAERLVVDKSEGVLKVYDRAEKLVAQFPATMGSQHDPLPLGTWTIKGTAYNPPFHYNPDLFWDADAKDEKAKLPPGPNGPVGVVWIDISKPHYGIHGTPEPQTIGRAESHGCIRLTNWDAARLALMVRPGVRAVFQP